MTPGIDLASAWAWRDAHIGYWCVDAPGADVVYWHDGDIRPLAEWQRRVWRAGWNAWHQRETSERWREEARLATLRRERRNRRRRWLYRKRRDV